MNANPFLKMKLTVLAMLTTTTMAVATLVTLVSCQSGGGSEGGSEQVVVVESDTGVLYGADYLDGLRGMASGRRDAEVMAEAEAVLATAGVREEDAHGTVWPGTVKVVRWTHRGEKKFTAMRLVQPADGTEFWQGPTPASGFYGARLSWEYHH